MVWKEKSKDFWVHKNKKKAVLIDYEGKGWVASKNEYNSAGIFVKVVRKSRPTQSIKQAQKYAKQYMK